MAKQKFGLGRGLDALFSDPKDSATPAEASQLAPLPRVEEGTALFVSIESIMPNPNQPRKVFPEHDPQLLELSASIQEHGLIQPLVVMPFSLSTTETSAANDWFDDSTPAIVQPIRYQIIAGERRWRASRLAGLSKVPVLIKDVTPQQMFEIALIENIQRSDLNPIEEALAYQTLIKDFDLTQEQAAKRVGKERSTIANALRLLQLPAKIRETLMLQADYFTEGHARTLLGIDDEENQIAAMNQIIALHLSVRQAEELAARIRAADTVKLAAEEIQSPTRRSPEVEDLEHNFRDALMVKVDLKYNNKGKGTIVLHFNNQDELETLYQRLVKRPE